MATLGRSWPGFSSQCRRSVHWRPPLSCRSARLDVSATIASPCRRHASSRAEPSLAPLESLHSRLLLFRESPIWSRWYRTKNEALAQQRQRAISSRGGRNSPRPGRPGSSWKDSFNRIPPGYIVYGVLGLNGLVYLAWQYAVDRYKAGDPSLLSFLTQNVLLSWRNISEGRIWTVITCTFSHSGAGHFLLNALTFYFMAPPVIQMLGNVSFASLYMIGGVTCSAVSLLLNKSVRQRDGASHGASGAIYSVITFFACAFPRTQFLLFFVVPMPAWLVVSGVFAWDVYSAVIDRRTTTDGAGHVGGILAGIGYFMYKVGTLRRF